mmetsp:Transcript_27530/g.60566  ORF Transcript_27530/g.60566 Transcript_27530/m.60566 type:complete len:88 (+) Transcript_27530:1152-1415(+)
MTSSHLAVLVLDSILQLRDLQIQERLPELTQNRFGGLLEGGSKESVENAAASCRRGRLRALLWKYSWAIVFSCGRALPLLSNVHSVC